MAVSKSDASLGQRLAENLPLCASWLWTYWTPVFIGLALFATFWALRVRARGVAFLAVFIVMPSSPSPASATSGSRATWCS